MLYLPTETETENMLYLPTGTIIGFSSRFSMKHFRTKTFHYLIQWITGSKLHHLGTMYDNVTLEEAMAKTGVRKIPLTQKRKEIDDCVDVFAYRPTNKFTPKQIKAFRVDLDNQVGKKYSAIEALLSIFTTILSQKERKNKKQFCSKLAFKGYQGVYPNILKNILPRTLNPKECIKILLKAGLIEEGVLLKR